MKIKYAAKHAACCPHRSAVEVHVDQSDQSTKQLYNNSNLHWDLFWMNYHKLW